MFSTRETQPRRWACFPTKSPRPRLGCQAPALGRAGRGSDRLDFVTHRWVTLRSHYPFVRPTSPHQSKKGWPPFCAGQRGSRMLRDTHAHIGPRTRTRPANPGQRASPISTATASRLSRPQLRGPCVSSTRVSLASHKATQLQGPRSAGRTPPKGGGGAGRQPRGLPENPPPQLWGGWKRSAE